jgi:peptidoglycan-associated lipoprotein
MKRILTIVAVLAFTMALVASCGGKDAKKGPTYPACKTDANCADHNQVCMNGNCVDCIKDGDCKGKCKECKNNTCQKAPGCCKSNADCAANVMCIVKKGGKGTCKVK